MPQKKTNKRYKKQTQTKKARQNKIASEFKSIFDRTPTPYPFSNTDSNYSKSPAPVASQVPYVSQYPSPLPPGVSSTSSSAYVKAVSKNGKDWHVDIDVNGKKKHGNLTNSEIMNLMAYPAAKQNLKSQLLQELRNIPRLPIQERFIRPNFSMPFVELYNVQEENPEIQYIYKKGCSNEPMMLNKLSPLHEVKIVPESSEIPIHLMPMRRSSMRSSRNSRRSSTGNTSKKRKGRK
jgi:hypothetical protein